MKVGDSSTFLTVALQSSAASAPSTLRRPFLCARSEQEPLLSNRNLSSGSLSRSVVHQHIDWYANQNRCDSEGDRVDPAFEHENRAQNDPSDGDNRTCTPLKVGTLTVCQILPLSQRKHRGTRRQIHECEVERCKKMSCVRPPISDAIDAMADCAMIALFGVPNFGSTRLKKCGNNPSREIA